MQRLTEPQLKRRVPTRGLGRLLEQFVRSFLFLFFLFFSLFYRRKTSIHVCIIKVSGLRSAIRVALFEVLLSRERRNKEMTARRKRSGIAVTNFLFIYPSVSVRYNRFLFSFSGKSENQRSLRFLSRLESSQREDEMRLCISKKK